MKDETLEIGPVRIIRGGNRGVYPCCHSLFLPGAGVLVDPGSDRGRLKALRETGAVKMVWLSHWHEDHWAHLDLFDDLPLWMHRADAPPLADMETFFDWYDMDGPLRRQFGPELEKTFHYRPRVPDRLLTDGERIDLGDVSVEVIHTPGHSPGHLALLFKEPGVLFMGDVDLTAFGPWYGDNRADIDQLIRSVQRLRRTRARCWITGHGQGVFTTPPGELWENYLGVIRHRSERLLTYLEKPRSLEQIVNQWIVYGRAREPIAVYRHAELSVMRKHLSRFIDQNRIRRDPGGNYCCV